MKEIFRAQLEDCDEWVEGEYIPDKNLIIDSSGTDWAVKPETVEEVSKEE